MRKRTYFTYLIHNKTNGRSYAGKCVDNFMARFKIHLCQLKNNKHNSKILQRDYNKGHEFTFSLCSITFSKKKASQLEISLMKRDSYNIYGNKWLWKRTQQDVIKICLFHKSGKEVVCRLLLNHKPSEQHGKTYKLYKVA